MMLRPLACAPGFRAADERRWFDTERASQPHQPREVEVAFADLDRAYSTWELPWPARFGAVRERVPSASRAQRPSS
jgi:hypothetical protein